MIVNDTAIILTIAGAAAATYFLRLGGLLLAGRIPPSGGFKIFMDALPGTLLLSLVVPGVLSMGFWGWFAALATAVCAHKSGNLFLSMRLGMAIMIIQRNVVF